VAVDRLENAMRSALKSPVLVLIFTAICVIAGGVLLQSADETLALADTSHIPDSKDPSMVSVRVFDSKGELVGPVEMSAVVKSDEDWRTQLTPEQYRIARNKGTERAFCGTLLDNKKDGVYSCICCGLPLFASNAKFNSGTGWPSFFQPIAKENIKEEIDSSYGMTRKEILCTRCDAHLGHVFDDGPKPTGLRYCLNSESLTFTESKGLANLADPALRQKKSTVSNDATLAEAVFAGGCFWCVEAVFEELEGVKDVISGYAGGMKSTADYKTVCTGKTGHAEAVKIIYDPTKLTYEELLKVHFAMHDPTTLNRQGADVGTQYRSAIFFLNDEQRQIAQAFIEDLNTSKIYKQPIVTTLEPLTGGEGKEFYAAEAYHQNYVCTNPNQSYVRSAALPKVAKVREKFKKMLKETSPLEKK
jgi:peptide methionine sulfoxide reductase msrA/msrB